MKELTKIIDHIRNRSFMSGIARDKLRTKITAEFFTPTDVVNDRLDELDPKVFADPNQNFIDPAGCGDGQWLGEILIRKLENGIEFEQALSTIYGVDLMQDNINLCRERLLCGREDLKYIVEKNIVCADALRYHFRFDGTDPYKTEKDLLDEKLFEGITTTKMKEKNEIITKEKPRTILDQLVE